MVDEMTVQAQRPSAMPYLAGGVAVGAAAGAGLSMIPALQGQKFKSYDDLIADANKDDGFVSSKAKALENDAEKAKPFNEVKKYAEELKKAEEAVKNHYPEGFDGQNELKTYLEKLEASNKAEEALFTKVKGEMKPVEYFSVSEDLKSQLEKIEGFGKLQLKNGKINLTKEQFEKLANATEGDAKRIFEGLMFEHLAYMEDKGLAQAELEAAKKAETDLYNKVKSDITSKETISVSKDLRSNLEKISGIGTLNEDGDKIKLTKEQVEKWANATEDDVKTAFEEELEKHAAQDGVAQAEKETLKKAETDLYNKVKGDMKLDGHFEISESFKEQLEKLGDKFKNLEPKDGKINLTKEQFEILKNATDGDAKTIFEKLVKANTLYKDTNGLAKEELKALETAKTDLTTAAGELKKKNGGAKILEGTWIADLRNLENKAENLKKDGPEKLKDHLKEIKSPKYLLGAAIGAAVLGLGALLLRPKAEEV